MSIRKVLFWIHLTTGCAAGTVVFIMAVTGVLMAYQRQITNWADRDFRSAPPVPGSTRLPMEAMLAQIAQRNPAAPTAIALHSDPAAPAEVTFGRDQVYLVDVYTGKVLGESSQRLRAFFQGVENWHRWLGASDEHRAAARVVTGACNFGFLFLVLSGPFLWIPRKWSRQNVRAVAWFRRGQSGRARDFNWHNTIGIWCAIPLFMIVLSGVVMSYPWANNLLYRLTGNEPAAQGGGQRSESDTTGNRGRAANASPRRRAGGRVQSAFAGFNPLWERAEQQVPGWRSVTLRLPASGRGPLAFTIDTSNGGHPEQRSQLTLDRRTAEVIRWEPFSSYNAGRRLRSWFRFLHTGEAGGIAGQTIAGVASAGAAMLVWTGLWLACRRLLRWRKRERSMAEPARNDRAMAVNG